jgi:hypothetical protein
MEKAIGKVYEAVGAFNKCPDCGTTTYNDTYVLLNEGQSVAELNGDSLNIRVAICECGNIFLRQRLMKW